MLDVLGIFVTSLMVGFIAYRAMMLDRSQPWFQKVAAKSVEDAESRKRWHPRP